MNIHERKRVETGLGVGRSQAAMEVGKPRVPPLSGGTWREMPVMIVLHGPPVIRP